MLLISSFDLALWLCHDTNINQCTWMSWLEFMNIPQQFSTLVHWDNRNAIHITYTTMFSMNKPSTLKMNITLFVLVTFRAIFSSYYPSLLQNNQHIFSQNCIVSPGHFTQYLLHKLKLVSTLFWICVHIFALFVESLNSLIKVVERNEVYIYIYIIVKLLLLSKFELNF